MPKSSERIIDKSRGRKWLLPEVCTNEIWARTQRTGKKPPVSFYKGVYTSVCDYMQYASIIDRALVPKEFFKKASGISRSCRDIVLSIEGANYHERRHLIEAVCAIMPPFEERNPLDPESVPEVFLSSLARRISEFAGALDEHVSSIKPKREQRTNERETAEDAFQRPFDLFIEKMSSVAEGIGIRVSASKDWVSPSPFVDLVTATLSAYRESVERWVESDWEPECRTCYVQMKLSEDNIERLIQEEKDDDTFALRLLAKHVETPTAAASAVADALARIRAKQARGK